MLTIEIILGIGVFLFLIYKYQKSKFTYWKNKGVKQMNTNIFFGDHLLIFKPENAIKAVQRYHDYFKGERFGGIYFGKEPFLMISDPDMLKQVLVKDAEHFLNHFNWVKSTDPLFSNNLFTVKDEKWKNLRTVMTTVFTSSKMKDMFKFMEKCGKQATEYLEGIHSEQTKSTGGNVYSMEFKDFFSRYGTDVIATTAFGLEVDSFKNPKNDFFCAGSDVRKFGRGSSVLKMIFMSMFPAISSKLNLRFFGGKLSNFFISLISDTIKHREENNIIRKDVIHILMEARKGKGVNENGDFIKGKIPDLTDIDITSQALFFFFGGFDTIASLLGFISYELAINPDIQEKLHQELDEIIEKENGVTYEGVMHQSQYLDMIINETLRKWPPAVMTDREVSKTYVFPKTDTTPELTLQQGDKVWVPIAGLHHDPEYFPNPDKFDPERFRDEKTTVKPFTYLPFGAGLRHCIGMRYALMEAKTILFHLLKKFEIVPVEKTEIPIQLEKNSMLILRPENGFWLGLKPRN